MRIRLNLPSNFVASGEHGNGVWYIGTQTIAILIMIAGCNSVWGQTALVGVSPTQATASDTANTGNGVITLGTENYKVVDASNFAVTTSVGQAEQSNVIQVGCQSCQTHGCRGNCRGGRGAAYPLGNLCAPCEPFWYASIETLFMQRQDGNYSASPSFEMNGYDFEGIPRLTIGCVPDCINGCELSFTGVAEWKQSGAASNPGGGIGTFLTTASPFGPDDISAFSNSTDQSQSLEARYWSVEANKTMVGYDVARCLCGIRYIDYQELYSYAAEDANTEGGITPTVLGSLTSETKNHLIGGQVGIDLLYPICRRGYTDFRARAGVFANFADMNFDFRNNLDTTLFADDDTITVSGLVELAGGLRFQVTKCISIRAGGELWWLSGVATATDQFRKQIGNTSKVRTGSDFFVAGGTLGAEFRY
ncbi:MAG: hypothetical protein L7W43_14305 [Rubripirellula sp.]|nr:hypothetical protein [Rubripirellula sp.]